VNTVLYYIALPLIYGISYLPFWWMYRLSDFLIFILYSLVGYRRKVVRQNLSNAFPTKNQSEIEQIERGFYRFFGDLILETIKGLTISSRQLKKRVVFENVEVFEKYFEDKQSVIIAMGHFGNWELGGARCAIEPIHQLNVIYRPLKDKNFNRLVSRARSRFGSGLYPMKETMRRMIQDKDQVTATAFIADQTPSRKNAFWMEFLHQDTPVFMGTGKIANKMGYPVVYASVNQTKRGYYHIRLTDLVPNPTEVSPEEIVTRFTRKLEEDINQNPSTWLWSHRRWKHKREHT